MNNSVQRLVHTSHRQEYIEVILKILITEGGLRRNMDLKYINPKDIWL